MTKKEVGILNKEQFIYNELGLKIANLTLELASVKADLNEANEKIQSLTENKTIDKK